MEKISVIGAGTMGASIAQVFATAGYRVVLADTGLEQVRKGKNMISSSLQYLANKEKITQEQRDAILNRIEITDRLCECAQSGLVVEAVYEDVLAKQEIFRQLEQIVDKDAILATNTSSISVTQIGSVLKHRERFAGMHFFNPAHRMKLVEVVGGVHTDMEVVSCIIQIAEEIGKTPVYVKENAGFVVNRILIPMINEAIGVYADGVAQAQDIDTAMKLGANHPLGPLALGDMIGLDVVLAIMQVLQEETGEDKYRPHPLLKKMVRGGVLGKKSGVGFYTY